MPRPLTERERGILVEMIHRAEPSPDDRPVMPAERQNWLALVPELLAGPRCDCGECPSIELVDQTGTSPDGDVDRLVLDAGAPGAMVLLFIDDGRPSYLELAPLDDQAFAEFPDVSSLEFTAEG